MLGPIISTPLLDTVCNTVFKHGATPTPNGGRSLLCRSDEDENGRHRICFRFELISFDRTYDDNFLMS